MYNTNQWNHILIFNTKLFKHVHFVLTIYKVDKKEYKFFQAIFTSHLLSKW